ncbi:hypothetical protein BC629DRAFT_1740168 [Irpex lacteus]|nr:hypothetical protein BC629DRAFT_1740168 [Irpex lacteus]
MNGPPIPNLNPTGQLTAIDVLNSAVGIVEDEDTSSSSASSSSAPSPSTTPAASNDTATSSHRRISPGAIAGIVVGVVIFLLLVLAGIFFLWRRRRTHTSASTKETSADPYLHVKPLEDGSTPTLQILPRLGLGGTRNEKRAVHDRTESMATRPSAASPVPESSEPETSDRTTVSSPVPNTDSNASATGGGGQQVTVNLASFERLVQRLDTVIASGLPGQAQAQRVHQEQEEEQPPRYEA